jgi:hypothetical protein
VVGPGSGSGARQLEVDRVTVGIVRALAIVAEIRTHVGAGVGGTGVPAVTVGAVGFARGEGSGEHHQTQHERTDEPKGSL